MTVTEVEQIPNNACNINQARKALQTLHICLTYSDHDFILGGIKHRYTIEYERDTSVYDKED